MGHGSEHGQQMCSWRLEAMTGQQIEVSLIQFTQRSTEEPTEALG